MGLYALDLIDGLAPWEDVIYLVCILLIHTYVRRVLFEWGMKVTVAVIALCIIQVHVYFIPHKYDFQYPS